jgi:hypothetical protein
MRTAAGLPRILELGEEDGVYVFLSAANGI